MPAESRAITANGSSPTPAFYCPVTTALRFDSPLPHVQNLPPTFASAAENLFSRTSTIKKTPPQSAMQNNNSAPSRPLSYNQPPLMKLVRILFGCIVPYFTDFSNFSDFAYEFRRIPNLYCL